MRQETVIKRNGNKLINLVDAKKTEVFKTVNEAKKESRKLQEANGGLGMGYVRKVS